MKTNENKSFSSETATALVRMYPFCMTSINLKITVRNLLRRLFFLNISFLNVKKNNYRVINYYCQQKTVFEIEVKRFRYFSDSSNDAIVQ